MMENPHPELVTRFTDLLNILSKKEALTIFLLAKQGLKAEADAPDRIGLTRKQYYTRLKHLVDVGLIHKSGDVYVHTTLGTLVHQRHILELMEYVSNSKQMKMIDVLKHNMQFSEDDIAGFMGKMSDGMLYTNMLPSCKMIWSSEDLVSAVTERIKLAESEVLFASRFMNEMIADAMGKKAGAGLDVKMIADTELVIRFIKSASDKLQIVDKNGLEGLNVEGNPLHVAGNVQRKYTHIPFSFVLFDCKEAAVEFVDSHNPDKFACYMLVKDVTFCRELRTQFSKIWHLASDDLTQLLEMASRSNKPTI